MPLPTYRVQRGLTLADVPAPAWDALLQQQDAPTPFMQHACLNALERSACVAPETGWTPAHVALWDGTHLLAACPLYFKTHSYGEYVFDWAWARAYQQHGLSYYPKALVAVPFTPVPGARLLARDDASRLALAQEVLALCQEVGVSSLHVLFASDADMRACAAAGWLSRQTVQFHWHNAGYADFDAFLQQLRQDKRKKIRQERRRVHEAGVRFRVVQGHEISAQDWDFFHRCYVNTYLAHGNPPYLNRPFFEALQRDHADHWVLFVAEREGRDVASSLIGVQGLGTEASVAYGRYWGALEPLDSVHFEACYYQPLQWCIAHRVQRFEGGAQGEHKMARALLPVTTHSAHWLAHPAFADAVDAFLSREREGMADYVQALEAHTPFKAPTA